MISFGEAIQRVQSAYSRGVQSVDTRLTPQHIYSVIVSTRSTLLGQKGNNNQFLSPWVYQTLPCVELIKAPLNECPCAPTEGELILRSKFPLPKPIDGLDKDYIKPLVTMGGKTIDLSTYEAERYVKGNKYTSQKPSMYIRNQFLYITMFKMLEAIPVTGLFEDPMEVYMYPSKCMEDVTDTCDCFDIQDMELPFDSRKVNALIEMASNELIYLFKQMAEDKNANSSDDTAQSGLIHRPQPTTDAQGN